MKQLCGVDESTFKIMYSILKRTLSNQIMNTDYIFSYIRYLT